MTVPHEITPSSMRAVLGHFATGLTVITAAGPDGPIGFTCQSFTSLSLEPALISINPTKSSATWPQIREIGQFAVNILPAGSEELATQFSRKGIKRFDRIEWAASEHGNPHLAAALAWVDCELVTEYDGGDHSIALGKVKSLRSSGRIIEPLLFFRGQFAALQLPKLAALSA
ncbi:flavin reductase family protein [Renibacterium salmoninarum]|uniref:flavin reductase family protein n=1 Tax=Renibacterium salmoninarum TaxID=1646 RepID=UPI0002EC7576|nr:flavin reductase family protein [Renibacterium salmoninarum]